MANSPRTGSQIIYTILPQSSIGQILVPNYAHRIYIEAITTPSPVEVVDVHAYTGYPGPTDSTIIPTTSGSHVEFDIVGLLDVYDSYILDTAHFQKVTEGATTPYEKSYEPYSTHPADNAVAAFTLWEHYPGTGLTHVYRDIVVQTKTVSADADDKFVKQSLHVHAFKTSYTEDDDAYIDDNQHSGSLAGNAGGGYVNNGLAITADFGDGNGAVSIPWKAYSCTTTYASVKGSYPDGDSFHGWYMLGQQGSMSLTIHKTDDNRVETALANIRSNTPVTIVVRKGDGGSLGHVSDTFRCKITDPGLSKDPESSIMAAVTGPLSMGNDGTVFRTFTVTDGADREL